MVDQKKYCLNKPKSLNISITFEAVRYFYISYNLVEDHGVISGSNENPIVFYKSFSESHE